MWGCLTDQKVGECGYSFASLFPSNKSSSVSVLLSVSFLSWSLSSWSWSDSWWSCNDLDFLNDFETVVVPLNLRLFRCLVSASVKSLSSTMRVSLSMTLIWWSMLQQFLDICWPLKETMHVWSPELGKNVCSAWQRRTFSFGSPGWFLSSPGGEKKSQSCRMSCTTAVLAASSSEVFSASATWVSFGKARLASHLVNLPEQFCCFFLFISSFNWLTSAKSFSTDRSLTSTVKHIFCKKKSVWSD